MCKENFTLCLILIYLMSCGNKKTDYINTSLVSGKRLVTEKNELNMLLKYEVDANGIKDGKEAIYWSSGKLAGISYYKKGMLNGRKALFLPNVFTFKGVPYVDMIIYFKNNVADGRLYKFYESGRLEYVQDWKEGVIIDDAYYFNEDGKFKRHELYKQNGKLGFCHYYDSSGHIIADR